MEQRVEQLIENMEIIQGQIEEIEYDIAMLNRENYNDAINNTIENLKEELEKLEKLYQELNYEYKFLRIIINIKKTFESLLF